MQIRVGITQTAKELEVDLGDDADPEVVRGDVEQALADDDSVLWLTDRKGRQIAVPTAKVAYVEIGPPQDSPRIGFA